MTYTTAGFVPAVPANVFSGRERWLNTLREFSGAYAWGLARSVRIEAETKQHGK